MSAKTIAKLKGVSSNPLLVWIFASLSYWIPLYPARFGKDTQDIIEALQEGATTSQWTALYFRFFQVISLNGSQTGLASLVSLAVYAFSIEFFLREFTKSSKALNIVRLCFAFSPFFGVFGMTLDHQLFSTSGLLNLLTILRISISDKPHGLLAHSPHLFRFWILFSLLLAQMTFQGVVICVIFVLLYYRKFAIFFLTGLIIFFLASPSILRVSSASLADLRMIPILGDIKCVVQHPQVELTTKELLILETLSPIESWKSQKSCILADNAFFALKGSSRYSREVASLWFSLSQRYPQLVLQAHLQRSSVALPPPFFRGQPNMMPTNDLVAAGRDTSVELQQWSELFKTSIDNEDLKSDKPLLIHLLEPIPLLLVFIFNQNSQFWGWGGMWFSVVVLLCFVRYKRIPRAEGFTIIFFATLSLVLFLISPASSPRYVMLQIILGIIYVLNYTCEWLFARQNR